MRALLIIPTALAGLLALAQGSDKDAIGHLVKSLGSADFRQREAAVQALKGRPDALPALREALQTPDPEARRRAATLVEYHECRSVRELETAAKEGRAERMIELLAAWPQGKQEEDAWIAARGLAQTLARLHEKTAGAKMERVWQLPDHAPMPLIAQRLTESTEAKTEGSYFVRAGEVDLNRNRGAQEKIKNTLGGGMFLIASGSVRILAYDSHVIFAGGSVDLEGDIDGSLVVSGGNVTLKGTILSSLIIARGKVTCSGPLRDSRVICGKTADCDKRDSRSSLITENDTNPLGFIRWTDAPKEKARAKGK